MKEYEDGFIDPEAFQERVSPAQIAELQRREAEKSQRIYVFVALPQLAESIYFKKWVSLIVLSARASTSTRSI